MTALPELILASSSPYRRTLLERLGMPFRAVSPDVDEARRPEEDAHTLVIRLARAKAQALAAQFPRALIIGSDQVASAPDGSILTKPGNFTRARDQLAACQGRTVTFHTGLCVLDCRNDERVETVEPFRVHFRPLSDTDIRHYLHKSSPTTALAASAWKGWVSPCSPDWRAGIPTA